MRGRGGPRGAGACPARAPGDGSTDGPGAGSSTRAHLGWIGDGGILRPAGPPVQEGARRAGDRGPRRRVPRGRPPWTTRTPPRASRAPTTGQRGSWPPAPRGGAPRDGRGARRAGAGSPRRRRGPPRGGARLPPIRGPVGGREREPVGVDLGTEAEAAQRCPRSWSRPSERSMAARREAHRGPAPSARRGRGRRWRARGPRRRRASPSAASPSVPLTTSRSPRDPRIGAAPSPAGPTRAP